MKVFVLCSYTDALNDPVISTDYKEIYELMAKSYRLTLEGISQMEEEKENTWLEDFHAQAVIHGDWMEWTITELDLPLPNSLLSDAPERGDAL